MLKRLGLAGIASALTMLTLGASSASALVMSNTSVNCIPNSRAIGQIPTLCTATVESPGIVAPTGTVAFASDDPGTFSLSPTAPNCTLVSLAPTFLDRSACQVAYAPTAVGDGTHIITGNYSGDLVFDPSANLFFLMVTDTPPVNPPATPSPNQPAGGVIATATPSTAPAKRCKKGQKLKRGKCVKKKKK